jgi:hypothetical protein
MKLRSYEGLADLHVMLDLLSEGLRRLKSEGMNEADVCTNYDNVAAIRWYESVGFQLDKKLWTCKKMRTT